MAKGESFKFKYCLGFWILGAYFDMIRQGHCAESIVSFTFRTLRKLSVVDLCLVKNLCLFCESPLLLFGLFFVFFHANMVCAVTDGIE